MGIFVLRQAQHERLIFTSSQLPPFTLSLSKGGRRIFNSYLFSVPHVTRPSPADVVWPGAQTPLRSAT